MTKKKDIRRLGTISLLLFGCLCLLGIWRGKLIPTYFFGFLSVAGLGFILIPGPMKPIYERWLKISHFIGRIITAFFLILAYYLVITPSALIKRIFGEPPLPLNPDKKATTYWVTRDEPAQPKERFSKRY